MKIILPLMKNILTQLAKSVLISLESKAAVLAADAEIRKKFGGSVTSDSETTELIISLEETKAIMKIVIYLEDPSILVKGIVETVENKKKEQRDGFLSLLLGTLGSNLLGNILSDRGTVVTKMDKGGTVQ